jgi:exoribonuclease R
MNLLSPLHHQSTNQPTNQPNNQSINQSIKQSNTIMTTATTMASTTTAASSNHHHRCWIQRDFLKDKLRVKERYWHSFEEVSKLLSEQLFVAWPNNYQQQQQQQFYRWIIPDALTWRKYLPLIVYLIERERDTARTTVSMILPSQWILLESVVEYMDYRNMSSMINMTDNLKEEEEEAVAAVTAIVPPEKVTPQERSKLQKLLYTTTASTAAAVIPFCDLSVRQQLHQHDDDDDEYDEWNMMHYEELSIAQRSKHALFRAVRLLQQLQPPPIPTTSRRPCADETISSSLLPVTTSAATTTITIKPEIWILLGDADFVQQQQQHQQCFPEVDGVFVKTLKIQDLLDTNTNHTNTATHWFLSSSNVTTTTRKSILEHARRIAKKCEEDYLVRNDINNALALSSQAKNGNNNIDNEYWTNENIQVGLCNKTLIQGRFMVTKENPQEAFVKDNNSHGPKQQQHWYFINNNSSMQCFNRAIHQDIVVIQPLPKEQWTCPMGKRRLVPIRDNDHDMVEDEFNDNEEEKKDQNFGHDTPPVPSGRVVAIIQESRRQVVATMIDIPFNDESSSCTVVPMDIRIPKIRIKTTSSSSWQRWLGNRLVIQIDGWEVGSSYPHGHGVHIVGPIGTVETEISCLLRENQIQIPPFSASAMACLPWQGHDWKIPALELSTRRDLRSLPIFSVDPVGCQDIDDTMHVLVLPNGDIEVGVHIADVTYFVQQNSALDQEAQIRATTFYLVDRRFDMLPTLLSSDLCSLHGNVDRLAVSTIWTFSSNLQEIKSFWYGRSVIHNIQAMTYEQAHNILHDLPPDDTATVVPPLTAGYPVNRDHIQSLKQDLTVLTKLARILKRDREDLGGAVDLSSGDQGNELKFTLDAQGNPIRVMPKKQMEIHHTIAELMVRPIVLLVMEVSSSSFLSFPLLDRLLFLISLNFTPSFQILANTHVAKTILERFPDSALLRIHQSVDESRFEDLKEVLQAGNIKFDGSSNMKLAASLKAAESNSHSAVSSLFHSLATR